MERNYPLEPCMRDRYKVIESTEKISFLRRGCEIWKRVIPRDISIQSTVYIRRSYSRDLPNWKQALFQQNFARKLTARYLLRTEAGREREWSRSRSRDLVQRSLARLQSERRPTNICTVEFEDCAKREELLSRLNWDRREREKLIATLQRSASRYTTSRIQFEKFLE